MTDQMLRKSSEAEIVVDRDKLDPIAEKLLELGYAIKIIHWSADSSTIVATTLTDLEDDDFFRHVDDIVAPLGGMLMQVGAPLVTDNPDQPNDGDELFRRYDHFRRWVKTGAQILEFKAKTK